MAIVTREETHEGVRRVHFARALLGKPIFWCAAHVFEGILVDSVFARARAEFARFLDVAGVRAAITTHEHEDHVGNHALLLARGIPTHASEKVARHLAGPTRVPLYRDVTWGGHESARGLLPIAGNRLDVEGRRFRVIETPGHSWMHVAFQDLDTGFAFLGDAYLGKFRATRRVEDVRTQIETLRRLLDLDAPVAFPAHGPILTRPKETIWETIEYLENLDRRAHALHAKGRSVRQIRKELLGAEPMITFFSAGEYSSENVIRSLLEADS